MNLALDMAPINELKNNSDKLIKQIHQSHSPIVITKNGKATAVLQDIESFKEQHDHFLLLKLMIQSENAYKNGNVMSHSEVTQHFEKKFNSIN